MLCERGNPRYVWLFHNASALVRSGAAVTDRFASGFSPNAPRNPLKSKNNLHFRESFKIFKFHFEYSLSANNLEVSVVRRNFVSRSNDF